MSSEKSMVWSPWPHTNRVLHRAQPWWERYRSEIFIATLGLWLWWFFSPVDVPEGWLGRWTFLACVAIFVAIGLTMAAKLRFWPEAPSEQAMELMFLLHAQPMYWSVYIVLVVPVLEELVFRYLLVGATFVEHPVATVVSSGLIFGLMHHDNAVPKAILGAALAWLYLASGSIWAPIAVHAAWNAVPVAVVLLLPRLAMRVSYKEVQFEDPA